MSSCNVTYAKSRLHGANTRLFLCMRTNIRACNFNKKLNNSFSLSRYIRIYVYMHMYTPYVFTYVHTYYI